MRDKTGEKDAGLAFIEDALPFAHTLEVMEKMTRSESDPLFYRLKADIID